MTPRSKAEKSKADMDYIKTHTRRIALDFRHEEYALIKSAAEKSDNKTVTEFCKEAIRQKAGYDKSDLPRYIHRKEDNSEE